MQSEPSVLVLEDLDHALPLVSDAQEQVQEEGNNSANKTQLLRDLLRSVRQQAARVLLVATARNRQALNRELLTAPGTHTFDKVLEIQPPSMVRGHGLVVVVVVVVVVVEWAVSWCC